MKSKQRHELKSNTLESFAAQIAPFFKRHGQKIVLGLCGVLIVLAVVIIWVRSSNAKSAGVWQAMITAADPETYMNIADDESNQGSQAALWARLLAAETHYLNGIQLYFSDRSAGVSELKLAREAFETVLQSKNATDVMQERALFGLARCKETTADGNTQDALDAYNELLARFPQTIYKEDVEQRIENLKGKDTQEFYAWFAKQSPKPEDRSRPLDGILPGNTGSEPLFNPSRENEPFDPFGTMTKEENPFAGKDDSKKANQKSDREPVSAPKPPVDDTPSQPK